MWNAFTSPKGYLYLQANFIFPTAYAEAARGLWVTSASSPKYPPFEMRLIWNTVVLVFRVLIPTLNFSSRGTLPWRMFTLLYEIHTEWMSGQFVSIFILKLTESKLYMKKIHINTLFLCRSHHSMYIYIHLSPTIVLCPSVSSKDCLSFLTQLEFNARVDISSCSEMMFMRRFKPILCRETFKYKERWHEFLYFLVTMCPFL